MKFKLVLIFFILLANCAKNSSTSSDSGDLDVSMSSKSSEIPIEQDGEELSYAVKTKPTKIPESGNISPTAVIDWQAFFKSPPAQGQRSILEARLKRWVDTDDPEKYVEKGRNELALGRLANAETAFRKAIRLKPDDKEAILELASLAVRRKNWPAAFELLAQIKDSITASDDYSQVYIFRYRYTLAMAYIGRGERDRGHKVLSDLIGIDKTFAPAYVALASSYLTMGKDSVAEFVAKRGLDRTKNQAPLMNILGLVALNRREFENARDWFDKALAISPNHTQACVNRAMLSMRQLEYAAAEQDLTTAISYDPNNVDALIALGLVHKKQGNFSGAKAALTKALDLDPDNAYARFNLAVLTADELKKPNEAVRLFTEVMQTPSSSAELKQMAKAYLDGLKPGTTEY